MAMTAHGCAGGSDPKLVFQQSSPTIRKFTQRQNHSFQFGDRAYWSIPMPLWQRSALPETAVALVGGVCKPNSAEAAEKQMQATTTCPLTKPNCCCMRLRYRRETLCT